MIIHIFAFRWKDTATTSERHRAIEEIQGFSDSIPGLLEVFVGMNTKNSDYETGGVMKFTNMSALTSYNTHPLHLALLDWLLPLIDPIEVDFQVP